jgi:hypothetical protein
LFCSAHGAHLGQMLCWHTLVKKFDREMLRVISVADPAVPVAMPEGPLQASRHSAHPA